MCGPVGCNGDCPGRPGPASEGPRAGGEGTGARRPPAPVGTGEQPQPATGGPSTESRLSKACQARVSSLVLWEQAGCTEWAWGMCLWATGKSLQIGGQKRGADSQWGRPGLRRRPAACSEPRFPPLPLGSCTHASVPWLLPCEGPVALVTELSRGRGCGVGVLPVTLRLSQDGRGCLGHSPQSLRVKKLPP